MKTTLKAMLPCKHIAITAAAVVSFTQAAQAVINLDFVYDTGTGDTTASYSGTWSASSDTTFSNEEGSAGVDGREQSFVNLPADVGIGFALAGWPRGFAVPWSETVTASSSSGDIFGFTNSSLYGPEFFGSRTNIVGSLTFVGTDLNALGFASGNAASNGTLSGDGGTVNWSTAVVPEPSSYALIVGALTACVLGFRRRRR